MAAKKAQHAAKKAGTAKKQAAPAEKKAQPAKKEKRRAEDNAAPAEETAPPAAEKAEPAGRRALPVEASIEQAQAHVQAEPVEPPTEPSEERYMPAEEATAPAAKGAQAARQRALTVEESIEEAHAPTEPAVEKAAPATQKPAFVETSIEPSEESAAPEEKRAESASNKEQPAATTIPAAPKPQLRVLMLSSECVPFVKTGGLADVLGALPAELLKRGVDVRVMLPLYSAIPQRFRERMRRIAEFRVRMGWRSAYCGVLTLIENGVTYYFIDDEYYFGRGYIYGNTCNDEGERFAFFSKAALEAMPRIGFMPDVLHAHDWQAAMSIALLRLQYDADEGYRRVRTLYTIHNLRYQGVFDWAFMDELLSLGPDCFTGERLEYYGKVNFMKGALAYADRITTVSPTYAREIQTPAYGETLDGVLRWRANDIYGILNGIDEALYDPETDPAIAAHFSAADPSGKAVCKAAVQKELGLAEDPDIPLIGIVTRFTNQKGLELVEYGMTSIMEKYVQLAVLGNGDARYEHLFSWASWRYAGGVGARYSYDAALANRIYAGADMFLMPSQFEPCGLAQLIAMRYGAAPIVRETGGLKDTVIPYNKFTGEGTGFSFMQYDWLDMVGGIDRALELYYRPDEWAKLRRRAMEARFTWDGSAERYIELYEGLRR